MVFLAAGLALNRRRVEDAERAFDQWPQVGAVFGPAGLQELAEEALLPDACVVSEEDEPEPYEEHVEVVAREAGHLPRVMSDRGCPQVTRADHRKGL